MAALSSSRGLWRYLYKTSACGKLGETSRLAYLGCELNAGIAIVFQEIEANNTAESATIQSLFVTWFSYWKLTFVLLVYTHRLMKMGLSQSWIELQQSLTNKQGDMGNQSIPNAKFSSQLCPHRTDHPDLQSHRASFGKKSRWLWKKWALRLIR